LAGAFPGLNGQIAFSSFRDGFNDQEIYVMDADGTDQIRLTDIRAYNDVGRAYIPSYH
jgi:Tol biopolymer transport system component